MAEKEVQEPVNEMPGNQEGSIDINSDENLSGSSHLNEPIGEDSEVEKLKAELDEAKDKLLRKAAKRCKAENPAGGFSNAISRSPDRKRHGEYAIPEIPGNPGKLI